MTVPGSFVAVDWGTSSFRAWRVAPGGGVTAETRSGEGMSQVPPGGFAAVLAARLADLGLAPAAPGEAPLPVVLCGMVGARQGWREAGYLDVPVPLAAVADAAIRVPSEGIDARILPGLARRAADRPDVLRGEETQLLGLVLADPAASGIVCMPGTHSKWVTLEAGAATDFATVMTGELFAVLSGASILRHAIGEAAASGDPDSPDFRAGLADGLGDPAGVVQRLFSIRARGLLSGVDGAAAADRLSGLLIGGEVGDRLARLPAAAPVHLVASGRLARLYGAAFAMAGRPALPVDADDAVRAGLLYAARRLWPAGAGAAT
jgi:2-dehydro-3-deoxygalactonokinase